MFPGDELYKYEKDVGGRLKNCRDDMGTARKGVLQGMGIKKLFLQEATLGRANEMGE
jgi:hypothetical protein